MRFGEAAKIRSFRQELAERLRNPDLLRPRGGFAGWRSDLSMHEGGLLVRAREGLRWVKRDG
jgi:hypothetical protein